MLMKTSEFLVPFVFSKLFYSLLVVLIKQKTIFYLCIKNQIYKKNQIYYIGVKCNGLYDKKGQQVKSNYLSSTHRFAKRENGRL